MPTWKPGHDGRGTLNILFIQLSWFWHCRVSIAQPIRLKDLPPKFFLNHSSYLLSLGSSVLNTTFLLSQSGQITLDCMWHEGHWASRHRRRHFNRCNTETLPYRSQRHYSKSPKVSLCIQRPHLSPGSNSHSVTNCPCKVMVGDLPDRLLPHYIVIKYFHIIPVSGKMKAEVEVLFLNPSVRNTVPM